MCYYMLGLVHTVIEIHCTQGICKQAALALYKKAGHWIVCAFGPWVDINEAFHCGLAEDGIFDIEMTADVDK
jgi:hypothetical protein